MKIYTFINQLTSAGLYVNSFDIDSNFDIKNLSCDSRNIKKDTCFFVKGVNFKEEYLASAIEKGAVIYISEKDYKTEGFPRIIVSDIRKAMPLCADTFYKISSAPFSKIGITGTKGKTSTAYLLKNIFDRAYDNKVGLISTIEALSCGKELKKSGTTPESLELYSIYSRFKKDKVLASVCEVSSQALQYHRTDNLKFDYGVYLNLSPDHISPTEHHSFNEYKEAKKLLLKQSNTSVINIDDPYAIEMINSAPGSNIITFGLEKPADITAFHIKEDAFGSTFTCHSNHFPDFKVELPLSGHFNIYNALAAISICLLEKISVKDIQEGIKNTSIPGRMDLSKIKDRYLLVDYAHNLLSFSGLFSYAKRFFPRSKIIFLFGCQGNKALDRRVELPEIVGKNADFTILTSDDPAFEKPEDIIFEVENVLKRFTSSYETIVDREAAVHRAVEISKPGDLIILSGKGPEKTQIVQGRFEEYIGDKNAALDAFSKI